ncbi:N-acetylglucosamine repressor [Desulfosporosinus acididurans]|uniref:N-acetylglucosamine repressor n=1 Tax=Desulfosporosinus acididurans TaxID=476652 RepID=A0A0J1ILG1_9FIRM|nr:ROK family transcriptional regulator [Desulfosporosinus acididurans]KLU65506.1 N-acetylglucosamine repressor [Desulfosporosinus acididurans]
MSKSIPVGSFQGMKSLNKSTILNVVRQYGPISRARIAKLTKLTPPTVTNLVSELIESKLVIEGTLGESTGGRKPILLRINSSAFYVIGVYAGAKRLKAVTANLDGNIIGEFETRYAANQTREQFLQTLEKAVQNVMDNTHQQKESFLGIGVGMHGLVDPEQGLSLFAPHLNLRDLPIKSFLENRFQLPVEVENDVRAQALGESWFGKGVGIQNFICVHIGTGVGAGIIIDNKLYRGSSFTAGEIGHTTIDSNGPKCSCGNYGCLETLVGGAALARRAQQAIRLGKESILEEWVQGDLDEISAEMLCKAAQNGDFVAAEVLGDTGRYLGIGLANLINILNPALIILSGGVSRAEHYLLNPLMDTLEKRALTKPANTVKIAISELGKNSIPIGAFTLVLYKLFTPTGLGDAAS